MTQNEPAAKGSERPSSRFPIRRRVERIPPLVLDVALAVVVAVAIGITISAAPEPASREPDALAYTLGAMIAALLLVRRRWPVGVLIASSVILQFYNALDYPGFFPAIPLAVALYSAAASGALRWALIIAVFWVGAPLIFRLFVDPEPVFRVLNDSMRDAAFFGAIVLLGVAVQSRRAYSAEVAARLRRTEAERERVAQELRVAHLVQQQFLPAELPVLAGWQVAAFYQSAREVGGDFYDFAALPDGSVGVAIGDVTDKGAPAALMMATTQGLLRADGPRLVKPSAVLERLNEVLVPTTPENMFVTCLYISLDPSSGRMQFANAGHNLPYVATNGAVHELRATGMPLGLLPGMNYEPKEASLSAGARMLLSSDGLVEAHNTDREMFGFPRLIKVMEECPEDENLIDALLAELNRFTGPDWEQEDDITLVTLERSAEPDRSAVP
jgi:serine phosphatase RsbU (regulator of sigma subunit)